jgi:hypothetical protein
VIVDSIVEARKFRNTPFRHKVEHGFQAPIV